jgi:hypothetical protein
MLALVTLEHDAQRAAEAAEAEADRLAEEAELEAERAVEAEAARDRCRRSQQTRPSARARCI